MEGCKERSRKTVRGGEIDMDAFIQKRLGIFLLIAVGGLAIPLEWLIIIIPMPDPVKWYLTILMLAALLFGEEMVRYIFKVPREEVPPKPVPPATQPQPVI